MSSVLLADFGVCIPHQSLTLAGFRAWALSGDFPERGRIDFVAGNLEVDMAAEDLFCHGLIKGELYSELYLYIKRYKLGTLFCDSTRVSCPWANLSVEPDLVFVAHDSVQSGRVRFIPKASGEEGRYVEIEGAPDLIVEIVSDSSEDKDQHRLPRAYAQAGVREFWLADARGDELKFEIYSLHGGQFQRVPPDSAGFQASSVLGRGFRLERKPHESLPWSFDLHMSE